MESVRTSTMIKRPSWAIPSGIDCYGGWADCRISGVPQRFRWIAPGTFRMGSPFTEVERELQPWGKETPHTVALSRGFWLADTACTQELWQAVMGYNPSEFVGPQRPVEHVSWFDIQEFLSRVGKSEAADCATNGFRLPTEAEWEYAARAGAGTAFSFGRAISPDQANFNGEVPYEFGTAGSYRRQTVDVKALGTNAWGLHQMHGNVWEWCFDAYREDLGAEPALDPFYYGDDRSPRVVRGGGWNCPGHGARAAFRSYDNPDDRLNNLGFRLARGPLRSPGSA